MRFITLALIVGVFAILTHSAPAAEPAQIKVLLAFASYKERPQQPQVYFYEHNGIDTGHLIGGIPTVSRRSDHHPHLLLDGRWCAYASEPEAQPCTLQIWDRTENRLLELPTLNDTPNVQSVPTLSFDGRTLIAETWSRPQFAGRWDLLQYDLGAKQVRSIDALNSARFDERHPALSGDGRWLAYVTNQSGQGTDIGLVSWPSTTSSELPGLNSTAMETEPNLSGDGRWLAFASDRAGGAGGRDIWLYDCRERRLVPLPRLNSPGQEQSPTLSADGRFLAFVAERLEGIGERDVFLYDRIAERLLPLPNLNSPRDDVEPSVLVLPTP